MTDPFNAAAQVVEDIRANQYRCPHFRVLVIGRANAGKTTIVEKVCGVEKRTKPIITHGKLDESPVSWYFLSIFCSF